MNRESTKYAVARAGEIPSGGRKIVEVAGRSIGIFHVGGSYYALRNRCPHQGGPLCRGVLTGATLPSLPGEYLYGRRGQVLRCPWHGWEFDITTGQFLVDPMHVRVRTYEVSVEHARVESYEVTVEEQTIFVHL